MTTINIILGTIAIYFFFAFLSVRSGRKNKIIVSANHEAEQKKLQDEVEKRLKEREREEFLERHWDRFEYLRDSGYYDEDKAQ